MLTSLCLLSMILSLNAFQFDENGEFTLLQITDFHSGEADDKDFKTWALWDTIIPIAQPDLVILSGDAVSGYAGRYQNGTLIDGFYKRCWTNISSYFEEKGLFYAYLFGNHDDEADYNRTQIIELDQTSPFSVLGMSESTLKDHNGSNYWIPIYSRKDASKIAAIIWMFDTNDYNCGGIVGSWGCIDHETLEWYDEQSQKIKDQYGTNIHHIAYLHIPIPEYITLFNKYDFYANRLEPSCCPVVNTGFFAHVLQNGDISAMFVGHDHLNDYGGYLQKVELVYGRKSGFGGYGDMVGGRVVKLKEVTDENGETTVTRNHYVLQEDGSVEQNSPLKLRTDPPQLSCATFMNRNLIPGYGKTIVVEEIEWERVELERE